MSKKTLRPQVISWEKGKLVLGTILPLQDSWHSPDFFQKFSSRIVEGEHCFSGNYFQVSMVTWFFRFRGDPQLPQRTVLMVFIAQTLQEVNFGYVPHTSKLLLFKAVPYYVHWHSEEWGFKSELKRHRQKIWTPHFSLLGLDLLIFITQQFWWNW